ncbi:integral membrane protein [Colletotrichum plurivorum]|uniref:Integral membrane protein n=1 Tax=Colletotrichum plurivorum TaxID=2175906 RepID=A0A8H6K004_9PEZI|nr:integral membrane protein [Colletotrichum plurivorum]
MDTAVLAGLTIYNLPPAPPRWDAVGIFYVAFCAAWTVLVLAGMAFCWANRAGPALRLRGLPLSLAAVACLHLYWILAQITYPIGGTMPVVLAYDVQYFVMGTWFPLGIALFHASNARFLHIAKLQRLHFGSSGRGGERGSRRGRGGCDGAGSSWLCRLRNVEYSRRIMIFVGIGLVAQVLLTVGMWVACKKYHPTFGIPGTEIRGSNLTEQMEDLGRGWEWWPTVAWQVIWTWIVAPVLLWKAWGIRDTMGWRTQTVGCCLSSLHATPMFLVASYVPAFAKVNAYFSPSQWLHLSSMMFEVFTVFVPAVQVIRLRAQSRRVAGSGTRWDAASKATTLRPVASACSRCRRAVTASTAEKGHGGSFCRIDVGEEGLDDSRLLTMSALEQALLEDQGPLQEFSALSDFSGENIAFLGRVAQWKSSATWPGPLGASGSLGCMPPSSPLSSFGGNEETLDAYNAALELYADFVSPHLAEFPLNLPSYELRRLEDVFEKPARTLFGDEDGARNTITPFDDSNVAASRSGERQDVRDRARYTGKIPAGFGPNVFDGAQGQVKYLVLTNTWPRFVREMRRRSVETGRSVRTTGSEASLLSRVSTTVSGLIRSVF